MEWVLVCGIIIMIFVAIWIIESPEAFFDLIFFRDVIDGNWWIFSVVMWVWILLGAFCFVFYL